MPTDRYTAPVLPGRDETSGSRWLVFHGWGQSGAYWVPLARWLPRQIDLRWVRLAEVVRDVPGAPGTMERTRQIVAAVGDEVRDVDVVIGHSAGAVTAVCAAATWAGVRGLCLVDPLLAHLVPAAAAPRRVDPPSLTATTATTATAASTEEALALAYPLAARRTVATIAAAIEAEPHHVDPAVTLRPPAGGDATARAVAVADVLGRLRLPVTLVRGEVSSYCRAVDLAAIANALGSASCTVRTIASAGHSPHVDEPRDTALALVEAALTGAA